MTANSKPPRVFISYAWEEDIKPWVRAFAKRLRKDGIETVLDQWETEYGDQLPEFMERAVRASDFVILICTPKYKKKSDDREGGVGYEGHIITAEIFEKSNHRKFIPVLRKGLWILSAPSWAAAKLYIDLRANPYSEENYRDLLRTLHGRKPIPPPIGLPPEFPDEDEESHNNSNSLISFFSRLKEAFVASLDRLKLFLPKAKPFFRFAGLTGIAAALLWASSWAVPQVMALFPTPTASITSRPTNTIAPSSSPEPFTKTVEPSAIPTQTVTSALTALPTEITDAKGVPMVLVPVGEFFMGSHDGYADEEPVHEVYLASYYLDKFEVTNASYKSCVDAGVCSLPQRLDSHTRSIYYGNLQFDNYPVINVNWIQAKAYCEWRGARLPTEAEWEKAARGTDAYPYPWGSETNFPERANYYDSRRNSYSSGDTVAVNTYESGKSPYGSYNMAGNVWEWVADWYSGSYYQNSPASQPLGPDIGRTRVLRGGAWTHDVFYLRVSLRYGQSPDIFATNIGFRCTKDATP